MQVSRRALIGGGAALVGTSAVAGLAQRPLEEVAADLSLADLEALDIPVMLSVTDSSAGELEILVGEQAITFTDRQLIAKLASAARRETI